MADEEVVATAEVKLSKEGLEALDALAARWKVSREDVLRLLLADEMLKALDKHPANPLGSVRFKEVPRGQA